jgi:hypothetical protein
MLKKNSRALKTESQLATEILNILFSMSVVGLPILSF